MAEFIHQGCRLHYQDQGIGVPVLLLHGLGSCLDDWEYQLPALTDHYRVVAVDLRGHGQSDKPSGRYSIKGFAEDVAALLRHLRLEPVHLVGLSMGGMIGFQLGVDHPELLRSLTIINAGPQLKLKTGREKLEGAKRWLLTRLVSIDKIGTILAQRLFPEPHQLALRERVARRWAANDPKAYRKSFDALIGWGVEERIDQIHTPTLVVSADRDYTPVAFKQAFVARMPNARLEVIEQSRHATPLDQPDAFNQTLLHFLSAVDTSTQGSLTPC